MGPSAVSRRRDEAHVLVLGGGLAGLKCAHDLVVKHGFQINQVTLLEGSPSIGGRIKSDTSLVKGFSVDLGAELIHGDTTSLYRLAEENGWEMEELISLAQGDGGPLPAESNDGFGLFYLGGEKRMLGMDSKDPDFVHLNEYLGSLAGLWPVMRLRNSEEECEVGSTNGPSTARARDLSSSSSRSSSSTSSSSSSVAHIASHPASAGRGTAPEGDLMRHERPLSLRDGLLQAGVSESMIGVAEAGYANTVGAALEDTSLAGTCFLEHEWDVDGDRTFVLKGSMMQVVKKLSAGIQSCIRTDWPVSSVNYTANGRVTVTCRDGRTEHGTHVVSALPLSVLKSNDVEFSPPLPEAKQVALHRMGMCSVVKVILKFDRPVLPPLLHGCICSESFIPEFWFRHMPDIPTGGYTMLAIGFAAGPPADAVSALDPDEALKKALDQLDDMFRGRKWLEGGGCTGKGDWEAGGRHGQNESDSRLYETKGHVDLANDNSEARQNMVQRNGTNRGGECISERSSVKDSEPAQLETQQDRRPRHKSRDEDQGGPQMDREEVGELPSTAYVGGLVHDWVKDEPFVRGGYSYPSFGFDENTHADAASSLDGRLFFAGEHTNTPTGMTVHAAIDSGERAALELLEVVTGVEADGEERPPSGVTAAQAPRM